MNYQIDEIKHVVKAALTLYNREGMTDEMKKDIENVIINDMIRFKQIQNHAEKYYEVKQARSN